MLNRHRNFCSVNVKAQKKHRYIFLSERRAQKTSLHFSRSIRSMFFYSEMLDDGRIMMHADLEGLLLLKGYRNIISSLPTFYLLFNPIFCDTNFLLSSNSSVYLIMTMKITFRNFSGNVR